MEEGLFRGLFPRMLNSRRFWKVTGICSLLFGFWHIVGPVRNYIDGQSSFQGMIANAIMLIVSSTLVGLKLAIHRNIKLVQTHKRDSNMEYNILIETDFFNLPSR